MAQFPSQSAASGLWSLKKQKRAQQGLNWPPLYGPADDYFEYVTMLLPGNGTNGAQNNTFLDSSTNNFTITRNGNTTQGTFSPYGSNWSNSSFSSSAYLTYNPGATAAFGTGDFTVEAWVFATAALSSGDNPYICDTRGGGGAWSLSWNYNGTSNPWQLAWANSSVLQSSTSMPLNTWNHCAYVRSGTTGTLYLNGVSIATWTDSYNYSASVTSITIGRRFTLSTGTQFLPGYLSNFRIVKGTAVYTGAFTPPTAPLTAITNTVLLTCQSNRFIDNSTNAYAITVNGSPSVQRFSPFNPTAPYAAGTDGGSGYFDGSGDYLNTAYNSAFSLGTGAFTVEAWVYLTAAPPASAGIITLGTGAVGGAVYSAWSLFVNPSLIPSFYRFDGTEYIYSSSTALTLNAWSHIAVVRDGSNNFAIFLNGTRVYSATVSQSFANVNTDDLYIARFVSGGGATPYYPTGYINDCRVIKGSAQYSPTSTTLTVPTAPLTAITNTSLLLSMTNAGILDNAEMSTLETVGNAQISTAQSKFGGGSIAFDGTGDSLFVPSTSYATNFGTGNFTIEFWFYTNSTSWSIPFDSREVGSANNPAIQWSPSGYASKITAYLNDNFRIASGTLSTSTWYHIALVRSGTTATLYIDGVSAGTYTYSTSVTNTPLFIGNFYSGGYSVNGYIDDLRITKGYARYTANFTAPTAPFPLY